jgi:hypothetical protein
MLLRTHAVISAEEPPPEGNEFSVRRMVKCFHSRQTLRQLRVLSMKMLSELSLCACRPGDQNRARRLHRVGDTVQEVRVNADVATVAGIRPVVQMLMSPRTSYDEGHDLFRIEIDDLGDLVVDPNQIVEVLAHELRSRSRPVQPGMVTIWLQPGRLTYTDKYA